MIPEPQDDFTARVRAEQTRDEALSQLAIERGKHTALKQEIEDWARFLECEPSVREIRKKVRDWTPPVHDPDCSFWSSQILDECSKDNIERSVSDPDHDLDDRLLTFHDHALLHAITSAASDTGRTADELATRARQIADRLERHRRGANDGQ